jgi:hypothetical protein
MGGRYRRRSMRRLPALAATALGGGLAWLMVGTGFANYDTAYSLLWGADVAHGRLPDYGVPVAPTPHPLATAAGVVLAPLGADAEGAVVLVALALLGALAYLTYALGAHWFGRAAGALAAAVILTRQPVLSFGIRAYVDLPYLVCVLAALLVEARRPRAGLPVLGLLGLAGLLRPEAWLFAAAYVGYLLLDPATRRDRGRVVLLLAAAAAAPLLWVLADLTVTGRPLYSLLDTREGARELNRITGLQNLPLTVPRRLGEILREPVLLGAAVGLVGSLWLLRRRAALPATAGLVALAAFCVLAAAGLPILGRYLLLPATLLAIFCGAGAFGWRRLPAGHPWRGRWLAAGVVVLVALAAFTPRQVERIGSLRDDIAIQRGIVSDLHALADSGTIRRSCGPVAVPNHRPVPLLALWLGRPAAEIVSAQLSRPARGFYVDPASARVERNFTLDPNDPARLTAEVPPGFARVGGNASWTLYARC